MIVNNRKLFFTFSTDVLKTDNTTLKKLKVIIVNNIY